MNSDDPRLTAYALGELPASERIEIERVLGGQPRAGREIEETREIAGILRGALHAEPSQPLAEHQRWAILRLAGAVRRGVSANERNAAEPAWWGRVGVWQTIAACAVFGFGVYAFSVSLTRSSPSAMPATGRVDLVVAVPQDAALAPTAEGAPEILTPTEMQRRIAAAGGRSADAAKVFPNGAVIVPPRLAEAIRIEAPQQPISNPDASSAQVAEVAGVVEVKRENERTIISIPDAARVARNGTQHEAQPGVRKPTLIGADPVSANASIGRVSAKPPSDEVVGTYLVQRMNEAARVGEGSTVGEFRKVFRPDAKVPGRFEMIRCKAIKVDVGFSGAGDPVSDDARVKMISKPYLDVR